MFKGIEINCGGVWQEKLFTQPISIDNIAAVNAALALLHTTDPNIPLLVWSYDTDLDLYAISASTTTTCDVREMIYGVTKFGTDKCVPGNEANPPKKGCTNRLANNFDPLAVFDDGSCSYTLDAPNPSGVMAGNIRVIAGINGDLADGVDFDPNICSPAVYYGIVATSNNQQIIDQIQTSSRVSLDTWVKNTALNLPNFSPEIYYCGIYGLCGMVAPATQPNGSDWNTITNTWPMLHAVKFQGGRP